MVELSFISISIFAPWFLFTWQMRVQDRIFSSFPSLTDGLICWNSFDHLCFSVTVLPSFDVKCVRQTLAVKRELDGDAFTLDRFIIRSNSIQLQSARQVQRKRTKVRDTRIHIAWWIQLRCCIRLKLLIRSNLICINFHIHQRKEKKTEHNHFTIVMWLPHAFSRTV